MQELTQPEGVETLAAGMPPEKATTETGETSTPRDDEATTEAREASTLQGSMPPEKATTETGETSTPRDDEATTEAREASTLQGSPKDSTFLDLQLGKEVLMS